MFWGTIHRSVLGELLKVFFLALIGLTGIILLAGIISEAMKNGFGPAQIVAIIPLLLPSLLPYTVPTTTLFATCIVYGRLSADNEILAIKAAGVHILHVVWPAVFLGLTASAVTMICYIDIIPYTGCLLRTRVIGDIEELLYAKLRKDGCLKQPNSMEIDVASVNGRKLQDAIFKRKAANGDGFDVIAFAKEAELRVDLVHKKILVHMSQCHLLHRDGGNGFFENQIWPVDIPADFLGNTAKVRAMDMTWQEMIDYLAKYRREKREFQQKIAQLQAEQALGKPDNATARNPSLLPDSIKELEYRENHIRSIIAEMNMRPALALGCFCFALVGCPVGIWLSKSDYLSAFITCFLPIVIIYYPLMFCMFDLSRSGKIPPWMGIYNADALMLLTGLFLFRRLARN